MLVVNRTTGTNGEQSKLDLALVEPIWITRPDIDKTLRANLVICSRVRVAVKDEISLWIFISQPITEERIEGCA